MSGVGAVRLDAKESWFMLSDVVGGDRVGPAGLATLSENVDVVREKFADILKQYLDRHRWLYELRLAAGADGGCQMVCCACPPPDEACQGSCPSCRPPVSLELPDDEVELLERLNRVMPDLVAVFNETLAGLGTAARVHSFSLTRERQDRVPEFLIAGELLSRKQEES